jgi:DNA polymerase V
MNKIFGLVDCNNFYVSCEQAFNPKLSNKPVVVLSNNDGCVISRSQEAKDLGITLGQPIFKCMDMVEKYNIQVLSSNFSLYGDISNRIMSTLSQICPDIEIYSIDEAFILLDSNQASNLEDYLKIIRDTIYKWTGIPVSIGAATTKTLAKVANKIAKRNKDLKGIFNLVDKPNLEEYLETIDVSDIWGIGRSFVKLLNKHGVYNAKQLSTVNDSWAKKYLKTPGLKTVLELRGIPCIELNDVVQPKKSIITSRTFGNDICNIQEMTEAISTFTTNAADKLRKQNSVASCVQVFVMSNPFKDGEKYFNSTIIPTKIPTANTLDLIRYALIGLKKIYKDKIKYKKAGVMLSEIIQNEGAKSSLFDDVYPESKDEKLMNVIDNINLRYGRNTLYPLSNGIEHNWKMKQLRKSQRYTTNLNELLTINI